MEYPKFVEGLQAIEGWGELTYDLLSELAGSYYCQRGDSLGMAGQVEICP